MLFDAGKLRIVPVLAADCEIPPELARFDYADFRQGLSESELDRPVRSIRVGADRLEGKA